MCLNFKSQIRRIFNRSGTVPKSSGVFRVGEKGARAPPPQNYKRGKEKREGKTGGKDKKKKKKKSEKREKNNFFLSPFHI